MPGRPRYARSGGVAIAYRVLGDDGPPVVFIPGFASNVAELESHETWDSFFAVLADATRVVFIDKRGTGLSDRSVGVPDLETRMDDVRAVMDHLELEQAHLVGVSEGGPMSILFAATFPDRVLSLTVCGSFARFTRSASHPWMPTAEERAATREQVVEFWGSGLVLATMLDADRRDEAVVERLAHQEMTSASPGAVAQIFAMNELIDVCDVLPSVRVPTLVMHDRDDTVIPIECSRYLAAHIPGSRLVETTGGGHGPTESHETVDEIVEFITGTRPTAPDQRVLATVLFTDLVGSTERAAAEGDAAWRRLLDRHDDISRAAVAEHRGVVVKSTGDGFLAHFDGPGRAVTCAQAINERLRAAGLQVRAGVHTGEIERRGDDVGGLAVHLAARVAGRAGAGEVLATRTVKDLTVGSGLVFEDRGEHELKGVPDRWALYAVS